MQIFLIGYMVVSLAEIFTVGGFLTSQKALQVCKLSQAVPSYDLTHSPIVVHWCTHWCDYRHILGIAPQCDRRVPATRWWNWPLYITCSRVDAGGVHWNWLYCHGYRVWMDRYVHNVTVGRIPKLCSICFVLAVSTHCNCSIFYSWICSSTSRAWGEATHR